METLFESAVDASRNAGMHFRGPDGYVYEFTQDPLSLTALKAYLVASALASGEPLWRPKDRP